MTTLSFLVHSTLNSYIISYRIVSYRNS